MIVYPILGQQMNKYEITSYFREKLSEKNQPPVNFNL